ncbi:MAG: response regulator [Myxococcota bacterium]
MRILIVDDDALVRGALVRQLRAAGFDVVGCAADAGTAVEQAEKLRPDVVTMDVDLGRGASGLEATRVIAARLRTCVVVVTSQDVREAALEAGACGFVSKFDALERLVPGIVTAHRGCQDAHGHRVP